MTECPFNVGVNASLCKDCTKRCGFVPQENSRRKRAIDKGNGLTSNKNGLRHFEIKRRK